MRPLTALLALLLGSSQAQLFGGRAFLQSGTSFLKSVYCKKYKCVQVARIPLGPGRTEETYLVTYPEKNLMMNSFQRLVLVNSAGGKIYEVGLRYYGVQDTPETTGKALAELVDFATGTLIPQAQALSLLENTRGKPLTLNANNASRYLIYLVDLPTPFSHDLRFMVAVSGG